MQAQMAPAVVEVEGAKVLPKVVLVVLVLLLFDISLDK